MKIKNIKKNTWLDLKIDELENREEFYQVCLLDPSGGCGVLEPCIVKH